MNQALLKVENLKVYFPVRGGVLRRLKGYVHAVDGVSFEVAPGTTLGLVGESGCGKTTAGRAVLRLYEPTAGKVVFQGRDLASMSKSSLRHVRKNLQMIFQDPFESLNSRHTVGTILEEPFIVHGLGDRAARRRKVKQLLEMVGLSQSAADRFPHEFSGGQRQRIGIARAIALEPRLIVCDEPVSALDVSIQSQILNLLLDLQQNMGLGYIFISHDLAVVKFISDFIAVMYLGKIVEYAPADELYQRPWHPYTRALIASIPIAGPGRKAERVPLAGEVPSPVNPPPGCRFHPRCRYARDFCRQKEPPLATLAGRSDASHLVACHRAPELIQQ